MRSWERALGLGAALALSFGCGSSDTPAGSGGVRDDVGNAGTMAIGGSEGSSAAGSGGGGGDFGNTDGMPPPMGMQFTDAGGVNMTTNPDDVKCGGDKFKPEIEMEIVPGNILLIFDKSGSMDDLWSTGNTKWEDAIAAIPAALDALQEQVTVGSMIFPTDNECSVAPAGQAPQIAFMPGPDFLSAWGSFASSAVAGGRTPLRSALDAADQYLQAELPDLEGMTSVVIVTDGNPNCAGGAPRAAETSANLTPVLANWLSLGVKTYVVGLPGLDGSGLTILSDLAVAGGTTQYIPADDPTTLQTELAKIVSESVTTNFDSCTIPLDERPPSLDKLNLVVVKNGMENAVDRDLGASGGWTIDAAGENIILQGTFCELAKMGEYDEISVVFGCTEAPPLEPPPPLI